MRFEEKFAGGERKGTACYISLAVCLVPANLYYPSSVALAKALRAIYLRVDVVEQTMLTAGITVNGPEGYMVCYELAKQNLRLGLDVIADTVNPITITGQT